MDKPTVVLRLRENGPLVINMDPGVTVQVLDHLGQSFTLPANKPTVALCRCGQSKNKPFCDGAHKSCGFIAAETVPPPISPTRHPRREHPPSLHKPSFKDDLGCWRD